MGSNFKLLPLLSLFFLAALSSASLLFQPSGSRHVEKRALFDAHNDAGLTNAQRLAAGLPLLPPRTRTNTAKRSGVSPLPAGKIEVVGVGSPPTSTNAIGYLACDSSGACTVVTDPTYASSFTTSAVDGSTLTYFKDSAAPADYPYLGAYASSSSSSAETLSASNRNALAVGLSAATSAGSGPQTRPSPQPGFSESGIWNYDATTGKITANWVNPDTSKPTLTFISVGSSLYITANPSGARLTLGGGVIADLYLVYI